MLNGLDLFSGIGGITLALSEWVSPIAYCESDRYCQAVLLNRQAEQLLPYAPIWDDIRTLRARDLPVAPQIIYGGFPCQDVSTAGMRKGLDGERTGLFRQAIRLVRECEPKFVFLENVPGIRKYVPTVRGELEALGYDCRDGFLSAGDLGAKMRQNNRWFLLAKAKSERTFFTNTKPKGCTAAPTKKRRQETAGHNNKSNRGDWATRADKIYRDAYGISSGVDRLRGLGNSVVPVQARLAFEILMGLTPGD